MKNPKFTKLLRDAGLILDSRNKNSIKPPLAERIDEFDSSKKYLVPVGLKLNDIDPIFFKLIFYQQSQERNKYIDEVKEGHKKSDMIIGMYYRGERGNFEDFFSKRNIINSGAKIDFNIFISSIEVIAALIFPNENTTEAIDKVIQNMLAVVGLHDNKNSLDPQIEYLKLKDEKSELLDILKIIHKTYYPIYMYYASNREFMIFDEFLK